MYTDQNILQAVCVAFKITRNQLLSRNRKTKLFWARVIAARLLHTHLELSLTKVGRLLHRSHGSVINYYKTFDVWIERTWLHKEQLTYYVLVDDILSEM